MEPVSLIAMVPVAECRMPTFTVLSVTASLVLFTAAVEVSAANALLIPEDSPITSDAPSSAPAVLMKLRLLVLLIFFSFKFAQLSSHKKFQASYHPNHAHIELHMLIASAAIKLKQ